MLWQQRAWPIDLPVAVQRGFKNVNVYKTSAEIIFPGFPEVIIDNIVKNIVATLKNISWRILSRRETPYVNYKIKKVLAHVEVT